jgi:hypothetical protein
LLAVALAVALALAVPVMVVVSVFVLVSVFVTVLVLVSVFVFVTVAVLVWVPVPWVAQASGGELDRSGSGSPRSGTLRTVEAHPSSGMVLPPGVVMLPPGTCEQNAFPVALST